MTRRLLSVCGVLAVLGASSAALAQNDVYAINLRANPNTLLRFPVNAPANNVISANASYDGFAIDFNADASVLYGITAGVAGTQQWGTIDTTTGNFTSITTIGVVESNWGGLSYDNTNGNMYALAGQNLYTINVATGAATLVAPFSGGPTGMLLIDIAVHPTTGQMYAHDIGTDSLMSIDKSTGAVTTIGPTGFLANFAQGMDFDPSTGILYGAIYTGGGTGAFASFDLTTGAATTIVSTTPWNAEMEMAIAPAPGAAALLGLGAVAAFRRRR
ncbi:MAG: hypothetical protein SFY69_11845 [Planctomycetota bacterium]|nr:hypothetical protein [Planctomycetota bacterium]